MRAKQENKKGRQGVSGMFANEAANRTSVRPALEGRLACLNLALERAQGA
jgi:hypothetical protein